MRCPQTADTGNGTWQRLTNTSTPVAATWKLQRTSNMMPTSLSRTSTSTNRTSHSGENKSSAQQSTSTSTDGNSLNSSELKNVLWKTWIIRTGDCSKYSRCFLWGKKKVSHVVTMTIREVRQCEGIGYFPTFCSLSAERIQHHKYCTASKVLKSTKATVISEK